MFNAHTVQAQENITTRTGIGSGRGSTARSVKHVEVLESDQWLALLILGDLDP